MAWNNEIIALYRRLLRQHDNLPFKMKELGRLYIREEFKKHREVKDVSVLNTFKEEWIVSR